MRITGGLQKVTHTRLRVALGVLIGAIIASLIWFGWLSADGKTVGEAMRGKVEDAIGMLEGILAIGILIGALVGLLRGLGNLPAADSLKRWFSFDFLLLTFYF
jgi:hypothetical protein